MDQQIDEILKVVDTYLEIIENPEVFEKIDTGITIRAFETCLYIENLVKKVQEEQKETEFDSHLNSWMLKKKKTSVYKCSNLKKACDKMLERFLSKEQIPVEIIDELLKLYIQRCGSVRLETAINNMLSYSMQANSILQFFQKTEVDIEDEVLLASWDQEIKIGNKKKVIECLTEMFDKELIPKLIKLAYIAESTNDVNKLILNFFAKKLDDNHDKLYTELKNSKKKVLLKLLVDNSKFQVSFIDTTFYMGRKMELNDEEEWVTDTGFSYDDLKNVINVLLDGSQEIHRLVVDRIKLAKELDAVWEAVEEDCIL